MPRYNLQRGSNILFLFFLSSQFNISSTYFFTPHKTRLLTRGWHFFLTTTSYEYANRSFRATSWKQRNVSVVFLSFFFFLPQFNYSQTFHVRPPSPILRWNGRTDSRRGIFFDALFIPADISSIDVYCLFEKAVNFSRSRSKVELMESKQESWLTRIEKMKFVYIFVRVRVQWASISLVRTNDKRIVCGGWYCREREKERGNKGIISVKFHVSFVTRVSFFSSFWWLVLTRINGRDSMKFSCIRNCSR